MRTSNGEIRARMINKKNGRLTFYVEPSAALGKYFLDDHFFIQYDKEVGNIDDSILYIPVAANLAPVAWATGADLHVPALDRTFADALDRVKGVMRGWYPNFSFAGGLYADELVHNQFDHRGVAQLFTAGIDSVATYARHRDEKPEMVYFGINRPFDTSLDEMVFREVSGFARAAGALIHRINSNMHFRFFDHLRLQADFCQGMQGVTWWANAQHGLGLLSMCAPLTALRDIQKIYIASSATRDQALSVGRPWGSHPLVDNNISWADVKCAHDGEELVRQDKIRHVIKPFIEKTGYYPRLVICNEAERGSVLNCGRCEKCSRTIAGLALEGIDPNRCGFSIGDRTFGDIKRKLLLRPLQFTGWVSGMWKDLQQAIPDTIPYDLYGSKKFFEWLRTYPIDDGGNKGRTLTHRILKKCYQMGIIP